MGEFKNWLIAMAALSFLGSFTSCSKDWLEAKPDKSLVVPGNIADFQSLLDNTSQVFNIAQASGLAEISAGDFYITYTSWASLFGVQEKSAYIWEKTEDFYKGEQSADWVNAYVRILNANVVLEGIAKVKANPAEQQSWNNVKGSALFFRAFDFFNLSQTYCRAYEESTALIEPGLPLRLEYDVNIVLKRSSLQKTYDQITGDLEQAASLLGTTPLFKTRPSKQAVFALLARTYLAMEKYELAGLYADSALKIQSELMDYSKLGSSGTYLISRFNPEVIFHSVFTYGIFNMNRLLVEPTLFSAYAANDLRKTVFFTAVSSGTAYRGNYSGDRTLFGGLATDELYLIRAEMNARKGNLEVALKDLNYLLMNRWKGTYVPISGDDPEFVLRQVLTERRKELVFRGLRWMDLRRLNKDYRFSFNLSRTLNGQTYVLMPGDKRYVLPLDEKELALSGIPQNER